MFRWIPSPTISSTPFLQKWEITRRNQDCQKSKARPTRRAWRQGEGKKSYLEWRIASNPLINPDLDVQNQANPSNFIWIGLAGLGFAWPGLDWRVGPGIPDRHKEAIFTRFWRADPRRRNGGVGIGLALVKRIVELHGGSVCVEDRPGGGARFRLSFCSEATKTPPGYGTLDLSASTTASF